MPRKIPVGKKMRNGSSQSPWMYRARRGFIAVSTGADSEPQRSKAQRVCDHGNGTEAHRGTGDDRTEQEPKKRIEHAGGYGNAYQIVNEREKKDLPNVAHHRAAEPDRFVDPAQ